LPLPAPRPINPALLKDAEQRAQSVQNRTADRITAFSGSMAFVYVHVIWFGCWIGFGVEKYPFGLLTMIVSLEAIFLSTFVMISQNRADAKRQVLADEQWKTVQEEDKQNEELLDLSKQILDITKEVHTYSRSTSSPAGSLRRPATARSSRAAHGTREVGEAVANTVAGRPEHAREHPVIARPRRAEGDEVQTVVLRGSDEHAAPEDLAGDEACRRVVRDLHDGAQQRLVHTIMTLKLAQRAFRDGDGNAESLLSEALEHAEQGNRELRDLVHGVLPPVLTQGGLRAGVAAVVARLNLPVRVDVPAERLPAEIEASAYFIVTEALTNVVKHAHAGCAEVTASLEDGMLRIEVRDNGVGGADPDGHGLLGMRDRVTTIGGRLGIENPVGGGTLVAATLPLRAG
ncbi:MAG: hypothetical protein QOJ12_1089, partial [Thermoleophilales bacterium]|nr:hypothetical protein [Thermoleophilales bacterium]